MAELCQNYASMVDASPWHRAAPSPPGHGATSVRPDPGTHWTTQMRQQWRYQTTGGGRCDAYTGDKPH
ncbi:hypothetical protein TcWFU_000587 [Taenia crassiceps]|uniref:Uncharacterized protein n=1 Tax=Taenia crassiceps TaxID=6207 RepID=A0ABR4QIZ1_9CEST